MDLLEGLRLVKDSHAECMFRDVPGAIRPIWKEEYSTAITDLRAPEIVNNVLVEKSAALKVLNGASYSMDVPGEYEYPVWRPLRIVGGPNMGTRYFIGKAAGVLLLDGVEDDYVVPLASQLCTPEPSNLAPLPGLSSVKPAFVSPHGMQPEKQDIFDCVKELLHGPRYVTDPETQMIMQRFREGPIR